MAIEYPKETEAGFSIEDWSGRSGNVVNLKVDRDRDGNKILVNQDGKVAITNENGDVVGYQDSQE